MKDSQYLARITKNCGPNANKRRAKPSGLAKANIKIKDTDPQESIDYFANLYRNFKD